MQHIFKYMQHTFKVCSIHLRHVAYIWQVCSIHLIGPMASETLPQPHAFTSNEPMKFQVPDNNNKEKYFFSSYIFCTPQQKKLHACHSKFIAYGYLLSESGTVTGNPEPKRGIERNTCVYLSGESETQNPESGTIDQKRCSGFPTNVLAICLPIPHFEKEQRETPSCRIRNSQILGAMFPIPHFHGLQWLCTVMTACD